MSRAIAAVLALVAQSSTVSSLRWPGIAIPGAKITAIAWLARTVSSPLLNTMSEPLVSVLSGGAEG